MHNKIDNSIPLNPFSRYPCSSLSPHPLFLYYLFSWLPVYIYPSFRDYKWGKSCFHQQIIRSEREFGRYYRQSPNARRCCLSDWNEFGYWALPHSFQFSWLVEVRRQPFHSIPTYRYIYIYRHIEMYLSLCSIFSTFALLAVGHLYCSYQALSGVQLKTLNKQR